jgi:hypothetical protein
MLSRRGRRIRLHHETSNLPRRVLFQVGLGLGEGASKMFLQRVQTNREYQTNYGCPSRSGNMEWMNWATETARLAFRGLNLQTGVQSR